MLEMVTYSNWHGNEIEDQLDDFNDDASTASGDSYAPCDTTNEDSGHDISYDDDGSKSSGDESNHVVSYVDENNNDVNDISVPILPAAPVNVDNADPLPQGHKALITEHPTIDGEAYDEAEAPVNSDDDQDDVGTVNSQNTGVGSTNSTSTGVGDDPPVEVELMTEAKCFQAAIDEGHAQGFSDHPSTCPR